jgi:hypothetical protein
LQAAAVKEARQPTLPFLSGFLLHDRNISISLICNHLPATRQARQNRGFGSALRQKHEAMAFISLSSAPFRMIHHNAFCYPGLLIEDAIFRGPCLPASGYTTN